MYKKFLSKKNKYYGFTLVELIIVITILAILATIAFVSFSGYTGNSRDSNRLFSLKEISKSLTIQKELTSKYPLPDSIYETGGVISRNPNLFNIGIIGNSVSNYIKISKTPKDPASGIEYSYGLTKDNKYFQVAGTLENGEVLGYKLLSQTYAAGLPIAVVEGNYKGVLKFKGNDSKDYIGKIPSLIYSRDGTYSGTGIYVINKDRNLPYKVNENNLGLPKIFTSTGVEITNTLNLDDLVKNNEWKNIPKEVIEEEIYGKTNSGSGVISAVPTINCPNGYILVPGNSTFSTTNFCIMKYESRIHLNDNGQTTYNSSFIPESRYSGTPWVSINQIQAIESCNRLGKSYHLITNNEWMTIARNIEANKDNWSGGDVGSGFIYSGHNNNTPSSALSATTDDSDGYNQTGKSSGNQKRTHILSNGQIIWDLSGNVQEHVNGTNNISSINGELANGQSCSSTKAGRYAFSTGETSPPSGGTCSFISPYLKSNHGPLGNFNANNGVGRIFSVTSPNVVFIRGGLWNNVSAAGVFTLSLNNSLNSSGNGIGFRCTFSLN